MAQEAFIDPSGWLYYTEEIVFVCACALESGDDVMPHATVPIVHCQISLTLQRELINVQLQHFQSAKVMRRDSNLS